MIVAHNQSKPGLNLNNINKKLTQVLNTQW